MNDCDSNGKLLTLSPSNIKFAQDSIAMCFQNDKDVNATCEEIVKGNIKVTDFPPIYVRYIEGEYFSKNNRRLYVFRVLNVLGVLNNITVKKLDPSKRLHLTTKNKGCHVVMRNKKIAITYKHCSCENGQIYTLPNWWNKHWHCHVDKVPSSPITDSPCFSSDKTARKNIEQQPLHIAINANVLTSKLKELPEEGEEQSTVLLRAIPDKRETTTNEDLEVLNCIGLFTKCFFS